MAKKQAKTASKNIPSQRGKVAEVMMDGISVVKVCLYSRTVEGKMKSSGVVAFKDASITNKSDLFAKDSVGDYIKWRHLNSYSKA